MIRATFPTPIPWRTPATILAALLLAGCAEGEDAAAAARPARAEHTKTVVLSGPGATARVTRGVAPDGAESLHGEMELDLGEGGRRRVVEDASLDARGRLVAASITVTRDHAPEAWLQLDAARGVVRVLTPEGLTEHRAASDAPWIYAPPAGPERTVATPVSAWIALRAAASSPELRLVQLDLREGWLVPRDQVAIPTELGVTAVIGDHGADASDGFIQEIRLNAPRTTLHRASPEGRLLL